MTYTITFNELRKIKDMLPHGSMQRIAEDLGISTDTVRNYFGADNYDNGGSSAGMNMLNKDLTADLSFWMTRPFWTRQRNS